MQQPIRKAAATASAAPLLVKRVDVMPLVLPLRKPILMAGVRYETSESVVVRIEASNGLVGWGEAAAAPRMSGDTMASMLCAVNDHLKALVVGRNALDRAVLAHEMSHAIHHNGGAKAAIEIALHDLVGKHLGVPVVELIGGARRASLLTMYLLGNPKPEQDIEEAREKQREGLRFFKLKVGVKPPAAEIAAAQAIRKALGPEPILCADANTGMNFRTARAYVEGAADADLAFLEQPFPADDIDGMARLARVSPIALCADEGAGSLASILQYQRAGAIGGANLKTIKLGGIAATMSAGAVCDALGLAIDLAGKVAESSIGNAALIHIGYAIANLEWGISPTTQYLADDVVKVPLLPVDGSVPLPTGPGLGIEVDEAKIERYRPK